MAAALGSPFEVNGAATGPLAADNSGQVFLRIEGFSASVAYRAARLADLLGRTGAVRTEADPAKSHTIWQGIRDVAAFRDMAFVARLSVRPSQLSGLCRDLAGAFGSGRPTERGFTLQADWGGGLIWVAADAAALRHYAEAAPQDGADPVVQGAQALIAWLQGQGARTGGHATLIKAPAALRRTVPSFQPEAAALGAISTGLRAKFDPRGILNRGLMT
jgi:glycolate oxidase FAD binding subunit